MYKYDREMEIQYLPAAVHKQLIKELSEKSSWKFLAQHVADRLELSGSPWMESLEDCGNPPSKCPAENLLFQLNVRMCTVEILCTLLENCNLLEALSFLRQPEPLIIERQPDASGDKVEVALGKRLKLSCVATGLPPPKYAWYHKSTQLEDQTGEELKMRIQSVAQEGEYRCKVSQIENDGATTNELFSSIVHVKIKPTPVVIEKQLIPFLEVKAGESFTLECIASSHPTPTYQWFCDNTKLADENKNILRIDKFSWKNEGKYYCCVRNEISEIYSECSTVVMDLPRETAVAKVALLIANENYNNLEKLRTPQNDVTRLSSILEEIGFTVVCLLNLTVKQMLNAIKIFSFALSEGVYGFFYFAGHGFKMQESYMLAVGAPEVYLRSDAVCESELLAILLPRDPALLVVVLDTCQTVPLKECNPEIHRELPTVNEYGSRKNLRNLIQAYSTSSHRPSYERRSNECGLYLTHLAKYIGRDIPVKKVFEEVGKSIDVWFEGKERNQIPMFALTVTKPYRLTDAVRNRTTPPAIQKLNELVEFPLKTVEIHFQQMGVRCEAKIFQYKRPFLNIISVKIVGLEDSTVKFYNSVPVVPLNLFKSDNIDECYIHNPQSAKGPIVISLEKNGKTVGADLLRVMEHVPALLHHLDSPL